MFFFNTKYKMAATISLHSRRIAMYKCKLTLTTEILIGQHQLLSILMEDNEDFHFKIAITSTPCDHRSR